jgi:hypothetical protein
MFCFVIDANSQTITQSDLPASPSPIATLVGYDSIDCDPIDASTDFLYFDDACFIRNQPSTGRFIFDNLAPIAGIGVIAGATKDGKITSPQLSLQAITQRLRFTV